MRSISTLVLVFRGLQCLYVGHEKNEDLDSLTGKGTFEHEGLHVPAPRKL